MKHYNCIIIGAGASGIMAALEVAKNNSNVLLLEKLPKVATKLKATGGGRCNLTNTLSNEEFMQHFGKNGRFMTPALTLMSSQSLEEFFHNLGVQTHSPDGFRVFPVSHNAIKIINGLKQEIKRLNIKVICSQKVEALLADDNKIKGVKTQEKEFISKHVIVATGGMGYPMLGAEGDGYKLAQKIGHQVTELYPAMMPLKTKERWGANCRADTIAKVEIRVNLKKYKKLYAKGDLIFTKNGIRGPVVLDFSREITPLLAKYNEVPIVMNLTKGLNEEQIRQSFKAKPTLSTLELIKTLLPESLSLELCKLANCKPELTLGKQKGQNRDQLIKLLAWTPLTINGHDGFKMAMITRGGVSLKEIDPNTMQSKKIKGLYFCGEVINIDGPCGGYNLQWAFASGYLAGKLL